MRPPRVFGVHALVPALQRLLRRGSAWRLVLAALALWPGYGQARVDEAARAPAIERVADIRARLLAREGATPAATPEGDSGPVAQWYNWPNWANWANWNNWNNWNNWGKWTKV